MVSHMAMLRKHMTWHVREFIEDKAHQTANLFDDGNLKITAVELLLPSEPELALCRSVTPRNPPPAEEEGEATGKAQEKKNEAGNEEGDQGHSTSVPQKRRIRPNAQPTYSSVTDSPGYSDGDRSSRIVLARDFGPPLIIAGSRTPFKRTKSIRLRLPLISPHPKLMDFDKQWMMMLRHHESRHWSNELMGPRLQSSATSAAHLIFLVSLTPNRPRRWVYLRAHSLVRLSCPP